MHKGQTIVHRFEGGTLTGAVSFLCPPPGDWKLEVQAAFFPMPGPTSHYAPQQADLAVMLTNVDEKLGGKGTSFSLAAYETDKPNVISVSYHPVLDTIPTKDLVQALSNRADFHGCIIRRCDFRTIDPRVTAGKLVSTEQLTQLLKGAIRTHTDDLIDADELKRWERAGKPDDDDDEDDDEDEEEADEAEDEPEEPEDEEDSPWYQGWRRRVRIRMAELDMSEETLARLVGQEVHNYLNGVRRPNVLAADKISKALNLH